MRDWISYNERTKYSQESIQNVKISNIILTFIKSSASGKQSECVSFDLISRSVLVKCTVSEL